MKTTLLIIGAFPPLLVCLLTIWNPFRRESVLRFIRNQLLDGVLFILASCAFLGKILSLGEADFGNFRLLLFGAFALILFAMLVRNYGFLCVRGAVVLQLLWANELLKTGLGHYGFLWILAKLFAYFCIVFSIYLAACPYKLRDLLCRRARP